jgi:alpha-tubulin suppressor-like RCC1 family protein
MVGVALGTPAYMAPEQIDGNDLDARVDVYSLGLVAWEMLTGRRAWTGEGLYAILYHQKHELPPDVRELRDDVPDRMAEVIARAIEKRRDSRWNSIREMLDALDESTPLMLAPRHMAASTGDQTLRFVRPPLPAAAPEPVVVLQELATELNAIEVHRRRLPVIRHTTTVVGTLSVAAIAFLLLKKPNVPASEPSPQTMQPVLQGDVSRPVTLPVNPDTHAIRPDARQAMAVAPAAAQAIRRDTSHAPAVGVAPPPNPAASLDVASKPAASSDSATTPSVVIPTLSARPRITVAPVVAESIVPVNPSTSSAWGGPPRLSLTASIVTGGTHSCVVSAVGRAACWGNNDHGQLGSAASGRLPVALDVQSQFVAVAAGTSHTCAISRDGAAWCWGDNEHGQAGGRSLVAKLAPSLVMDAHVFWAIAAGDTHTCAVDASGFPWCWGLNSRGQLGDPSISESAVPVLAGRGAIRFTSIAAGSAFTCGLSVSGRVSCWGENGAGQLGDGTNFDRPLPVAVTGSVAFTSIAAGSNHVCGLTAEGDAYCWGRNAFGQLGDGGNLDRNAPVRVRGGARFKSITAGANHTCAVAGDGTAYCWGQNTYGQLGTGGAADVSQPAPVTDGHLFTMVQAHSSHTCGLTVRGDAFCWGNNSESQIGDGTETHRARPTLVAGLPDR